MNGFFAGGLAQGLTQGLQTGRALQNDQEERELRKQQNEALLGLRRDQFQLEREKMAQQDAREGEKIGILRDTFGLQKTKETNDNTYQTGTLEVQKERNRIDAEKEKSAAGLQQAQADYYKAQQGKEAVEASAKQLAMDKERFPSVAQMALSGQITEPKAAEDAVRVIGNAMGMHPSAFYDGTVQRLNGVFAGVAQGKIDPNSPESLDALNTALGQRVKRNLGQKVDVWDHGGNQQVTGTVVDKRIAGVQPGKDGFITVNVESKVRGDDGKDYTYLAPLTVNGTSDPTDQVLKVHQDALGQHVLALNQFVKMVNSDPAVKANVEKLIATAGSSKNAESQAKIDLANERIKTEKARQSSLERNGSAKPLAPETAAEHRQNALAKAWENFDNGVLTQEQYDSEVARIMDGGKYGMRHDGSAPKGDGFLGPIKRPDGSVMTEVSVGVDVGGKEIEIPTMVPGLTPQEIETLKNLPKGQMPPEPIISKAVEHAKERLRQGKSVFAEPGESPAGGSPKPSTKPAANKDRGHKLLDGLGFVN